MTELTLYDVEQYRLQFSQNFQLQNFVLILHKLDRSSLEITWLLDVGLVQQLKRVVWSDLRKFLEEIHVKQVVVDGESVYQVCYIHLIIHICHSHRGREGHFLHVQNHDLLKIYYKTMVHIQQKL